MTPFIADDHGIIYRKKALADGFTDDDLRRACRRGEIVRVGRGAFAPAEKRTPDDAHRLTVIASATLGIVAGVVTHQSAAAMHRLPMLKPNFARLHVTTGDANHGGRTATRHTHVGVVAPSETVDVDGVLVSSLERTAVDIACTSPMGFAGALAVLDAALRLGADRKVMRKMLRATRRGVGQARRALAHATADAESPGESWCRAQIIEAGLPIPRLQHEFRDQDGFVARSDFDWSGLLVGEFDGKVKYQKYLRDGEDATDAVVREKKREDRLRRLGVMVIRWTWADLERGTVAASVRQWLTKLQLDVA
ncbi:type IV toxin-antitoxin system AbiEi family antitoxin domain-containing protein [Gordonia sp. w5E2]|uniref:Transcriptional regulator, AbiEi antitoxin, Type IV TA system n=1 Tax=Gordonia jacobaea TaxID=122202 RepID=A0ABR5IFI8_9ACTN|nr:MULTISPECIES: type IV toxin-antitoxin system AbiEi family antitoxin domain-containing protein [Gordonia]KNA92509.1 hypothetical protein ABW18_04105 [Gordonia jacobaea]OBB99852.1 hypothetical protein A5785_03150 [Gordonia sp. 852002-50395_SCH5434458]OBC09457.1 hypothetical protein A5786_07085 [Gordonia sp. 852002-50816_SCH5313054-a]OBC13259.1 hypothetical protein A5788_20205 [Gordonia sp. 852002-50816_SCH5313054-c]